MSDFIPQQKILRVYQLIRRLSEKPYRNIKSLAHNMQMSEKTVRRYLKLIQEIGYDIEEDFEGRQYIAYHKYPAEGRRKIYNS